MARGRIMVFSIVLRRHHFITIVLVYDNRLTPMAKVRAKDLTDYCRKFSDHSCCLVDDPMLCRRSRYGHQQPVYAEVVIVPISVLLF